PIVNQNRVRHSVREGCSHIDACAAYIRTRTVRRTQPSDLRLRHFETENGENMNTATATATAKPETATATAQLSAHVNEKTRVTFTTASGAISDEGLDQIRAILLAKGLPVPTEKDVSATWIHARGKYTTRLAKWLRKQTGVKPDDGVITMCG